MSEGQLFLSSGGLQPGVQLLTARFEGSNGEGAKGGGGRDRETLGHVRHQASSGAFDGRSAGRKAGYFPAWCWGADRLGRSRGTGGFTVACPPGRLDGAYLEGDLRC